MSTPRISAPTTLWWDEQEIPHLEASSLEDSLGTQDYAAAQDYRSHIQQRRRLSPGRWAEIKGLASLPPAWLPRRPQLGRAAQATLDGASAEFLSRMSADSAGANPWIQPPRKNGALFAQEDVDLGRNRPNLPDWTADDSARGAL